mgnify:CR=1 FL=1
MRAKRAMPIHCGNFCPSAAIFVTIAGDPSIRHISVTVRRDLHAAPTVRRDVQHFDPDRLASPCDRALPGIGDYPAGASASIAFGLPTPAVDGNVLRVVSRVCEVKTATV